MHIPHGNWIIISIKGIIVWLIIVRCADLNLLQKGKNNFSLRQTTPNYGQYGKVL